MDWPTLEPNPYLDIQAPDDVRIRGTRVDLCIIVEDFLDGHQAEAIAMNYLSVSLEEIYGAIAYYLGNRAAVDRYVECMRKRAEEMRAELAKQPVAPVVARLRAIKAARSKAA